jgi:phage baseplate assembly protein W
MTVTPLPADDSALIRRRLLGIGLRADLITPADTARDVVLRRTASGVDLDLVEGIDALGQDLAVALTTLRGSDPFDVTYGFTGLEVLATAISPVLAREALRAAVAALVSADPRVRQVTDVAVTVPTHAAPIAVAVGFEAVSGDPAAISLASGVTATGGAQP